jgi:GMP synthase (glutamine-hydrolysing)
MVAQLQGQLTYHQPHRLGFETLDAHEHDGFIILGSASNVTENEAWHREIVDFISDQLERKKAVLGICFGHQLMARAFEADVNFIQTDREKLKGTREVTFLEDFGRIKKGDVLNFALTHQQMVKDLSPELIEVARGLPNDIIRHRTLPFTGIQPHPEGSAHFCLNDALIESETLIKKVQEDGLFFVREWLETF